MAEADDAPEPFDRQPAALEQRDQGRRIAVAAQPVGNRHGKGSSHIGAGEVERPVVLRYMHVAYV
jgi:hypothetical protein